MAFDHAAFLGVLTNKPGVYRMINIDGVILYIGKAKNLRKRVSQYFQKQHLLTKTALMVAQIESIEVTVTESELDALLLEAALIKRHHPKYNILLRDDKSYPYIYISTDHDFPQLDFVRGKKRKGGKYFGPYPTIGSARETLALLQKCFQLRQCRDGVFRHRSRPCLQYQIKRCQAPCVGYVNQEDYRAVVDQAIAFLSGRSDEVLADLTKQMVEASQCQRYEKAAELRDGVEKLRLLQRHQYFNHDKANIDVFSLVQSHHVWVVSMLLIRSGELMVQHCYFPRVPTDCEPADVMLNFLQQYYLNDLTVTLLPAKVLLPFGVDGVELLQQAISGRYDRKVRFMYQARTNLKQWQRVAEKNAQQAVAQRLAGKNKIQDQLDALAKSLALTKPIERIECFDISHTQGEATKASCVVFNRDGACKKSYRQFDIKDVKAGDDYAAMRQAVYRRYSGLLQRGVGLPDLVIIDGGSGQLKHVIEVLQELQVESIQLLAVAKGRSRKPGLERLLLPSGRVLQLPPHSGAFHLLQFVRDEAHRFGIRSHRRRRDKERTQSWLESVPGIGPKKRQALLVHFGGLHALQKASVAEIAAVKGVNLKLADLIKHSMPS